jgi:nucleotide-binding universal stress UspA family protein
MKTILVPTDFSACANNALNVALEMAKIAPAEILVVHVLELAETVYVDYTGPSVNFSESLREQAEQEMMNLKSRVLAEHHILVKTFTYQSPVDENIVRAARDHNADLIVTGTRGAGKLKEKLWGTHTAALIGKSHIPVLAIPKDYKWHKPSKILLATSHFEKDQASWEALSGIIGLFAATLHAVVFTDEKKDKAVTSVAHSWDINRYREFLDQHHDYPVVSEHLYGAGFEQTLEDYISANGIDMLVMFTYKRGFLARILDPSKTKRMSCHTRIPLLALAGSQTDF